MKLNDKSEILILISLNSSLVGVKSETSTRMGPKKSKNNRIKTILAERFLPEMMA